VLPIDGSDVSKVLERREAIEEMTRKRKQQRDSYVTAFTVQLYPFWFIPVVTWRRDS
jgi:hypothetical protein